ncbi:hypothetical protein BSL84_26045 [Streptomyces sp. TN58]|nr:hypothetical protein BSL84_26045 [Streptomyces sp. TN58]
MVKPRRGSAADDGVHVRALADELGALLVRAAREAAADGFGRSHDPATHASDSAARSLGDGVRNDISHAGAGRITRVQDAGSRPTRACPRQDSLGPRLFGEDSAVKSTPAWKTGDTTD